MTAQYQSADLLQWTKWLAQLPDIGGSISDTNLYVRLAQAQTDVIADLVARNPQILYSKAAYGSTPTLTTSDNQVFTFGTDVNGDPLFPIGKVMIYDSLTAIPDNPWREGIDGDYLNEGTQIRIPNNGTYGGTLYWRGVAPVLPISSSNQPSLIPPPSRMLIVYKAVWQFSLEGKRDFDLADRMEDQYFKDLARWMLVWKTQFQNFGAISSLTGMQLAILGAGAGPGYTPL